VFGIYVGVGRVPVADLSLNLYKLESKSDFGGEREFLMDDRSTHAPWVSRGICWN
jgi:hypothetical protein